MDPLKRPNGGEIPLMGKTLRPSSPGRNVGDDLGKPALAAAPRVANKGEAWSGREDLNLRPLRPERSALPG